MRVLFANTIRALGANHPRTIVAGNRGFLVTAHQAVLSTRGLVHNPAPSIFRLPSWLPSNMSGTAYDSMPVSYFVVNSFSSPQSTRTVISTAKLDHILHQHATPPTRTDLSQICAISLAVWNGLGLCSDLFGLPRISAVPSKAILADPAPPKRLVTSLGSGSAFSAGSRLHATVMQAAEMIQWQEEANAQKLRTDNLQLRLDATIAHIEQLQAAPVQRLTIDQIIASGNIDPVSRQSPVSDFHGVRGAHDLSENWPVEYRLTPLAPNWVHSRVRVQQRLHF